ncbi:molybdopterin converting factor small subunit [Paenibacillus sp. DS2015]|uniref:hypothetical protein n=1 Tax=Paenibacillus sp. DS2015 TaxID=3373917 RepID=UPI003D1A719C
MSLTRRFIILLMALTLLTLSPLTVMASSLELSASAQSAFNTMLSSTDSSSAATLKKRYSEVLNLQQKHLEWDTKIESIHFVNEEVIINLRKQIKQIDEDKLSKLDTQLKQARERYKPLFTLYTALNQQITMANKVKNKELSTALKSQVSTMKVAVQMARIDVANKVSALQLAKSQTAKTKKSLRNMLGARDPIKVQIKAAKSTVSASKKQLTSETTLFKQVVKKGEVNNTLKSLERMLLCSQQIFELKEKIYTLENKITTIHAQVKSQIATK